MATPASTFSFCAEAMKPLGAMMLKSFLEEASFTAAMPP